MSTAAERLTELLRELEETSCEPWSNVEGWIAKAKPLFLHSYPRFVDEFNKHCVAPKYPGGPRVFGFQSQWDDARDRARHRELERLNQQADAQERSVYQQRLKNTHLGLVAFVQGVLNVVGLPEAERHDKPTKTVVNGPITNFTNSNVGSAAIGAGSTANGHVAISPSTTITKEMLREAVSDLQGELLKMQDRLEQSDDRVYEFLSNLLINVRKIQLDQAEMSVVQAKVREASDDAWAKEAAKGMKPQLLPKVVEGAKLLAEVAKNPLAQKLVTELISNA